jgi:hypothetical protein
MSEPDKYYIDEKGGAMNCVKCGGDNISTSYHRDEWACLYGERADEGRRREHLHYYCRRCSYSWTGATQDA